MYQEMGIFEIIILLHSFYHLCLRDCRYTQGKHESHIPGSLEIYHGNSNKWSSKFKIQSFRDWLLNKFVLDSEEGQHILALIDVALLQ